MSRRFIAVDLDGTLAHYDGWVGPGHIGAPVPLMLERVKDWLAEGHVVHIFTARARDADEVTAIQRWCRDYVGEPLPVTCIKYHYFTEFWDDKAVQVEKNTGRVVGRSLTDHEQIGRYGRLID